MKNIVSYMKLIEDLGMMYPTEKSKKKLRYGVYECSDCKIHFKTATASVKYVKQSTCRSCSHKGHGDSQTRLHQTWFSMKDRCYREKNPFFKYYGGKGIIVCDEWKSDYVAFRTWSLLTGYNDTLTIDRIDNNGNYEPSNCQWLSKRDNAIKSSTRDTFKENKGIKISEDEASEICEAYATGLVTQVEIAKSLNVHSATIHLIVKKGRE